MEGQWLIQDVWPAFPAPASAWGLQAGCATRLRCTALKAEVRKRYNLGLNLLDRLSAVRLQSGLCVLNRGLTSPDHLFASFGARGQQAVLSAIEVSCIGHKPPVTVRRKAHSARRSARAFVARISRCTSSSTCALGKARVFARL